MNGKNEVRKEYLSRIHRVQDYIEKNLDKELKLEKLAEIANFSPFHFHRIFTSIVGESLYKYIQRVSLEKAAALLIDQSEKSIIEIALETGFNNQASFARAFRKYFDMSPSEWRNKHSKKCKTYSKNSKESLFKANYNYNEDINYEWRNLKMLKVNTDVKIKDVEKMQVVYVRNTGPYAGDETLFEGLFEKLFTWAGPRQLINFPKTQLLTIYHDNPEITEENKQRISVCMSVPEGTKVDGEIGEMSLPGGKYAVGYFELSTDEFGEAWNFMCGEWLSQSGYQCDDRPTYELSLNDPHEHPEHKHIVEIYIPIKPL